MSGTLAVSELVIVCIAIGLFPPIVTLPILTGRVGCRLYTTVDWQYLSASGNCTLYAYHDARYTLHSAIKLNNVLNLNINAINWYAGMNNYYTLEGMM